MNLDQDAAPPTRPGTKHQRTYPAQKHYLHRMPDLTEIGVANPVPVDQETAINQGVRTPSATPSSNKTQVRTLLLTCVAVGRVGLEPTADGL